MTRNRMDSTVMMPPRLLAISPGKLTSDADALLFQRTLKPLIESGLSGILLREPMLMDRILLSMVSELRAQGLAWIGIHDRAHLGVSQEVDGVHLGSRSLAPRWVRSLVPSGCAIGFSAHRGDDLQQVESDYVFYGPVYPPNSKPVDGSPLGLEGLASACQIPDRPRVWALGGISMSNAAAALDAGAEGIALIGGIFQAPDPSAAVRDLAKIAGA